MLLIATMPRYAIRLAGAAAVALLVQASSCDSDKTYPVTFVCASNAGAECPAGGTCPTVPLSDTACGDLPGLFGHPSTPETMGHPVGCTVGLSYGNPYYGDGQQQCTCTAYATLPTGWSCPQ